MSFQSKHLAHAKIHDEKQRAETLETHKKSMQLTIDSMADKEALIQLIFS